MRNLCIFLLCGAMLLARVVAGVAITVNGDPITLYEIEQTQKEKKLDKKAAIDFLISQKIKDQELERLKIDVSDSRIDSEIQEMAHRNNLSMDAFLRKVQIQERMSIKEYKKQLKDQIKTQELMRAVLSNNMAGEDEIRAYYNKHQDEFNVAKEIIAMRFSSNKKELLEEAIKQPNVATRGVERAEEKIPTNTLPPQIVGIFSKAKVGEFTEILNGGNGNFMAFLIKEKKGEEEMGYQQARNIIAQKLVEKRQDRILEDYFEKIKQKASIITLRD